MANALRPYEHSEALYERARQIIPGGIHLSGRPLVDPESSPMYFERANGCRVWDVDGHEYIDYLMAFGPFLLGYANSEVNQAAFDQAAQGALISLNHPLHIRFIETLLSRFPGADMGIFFRTGSEATTAALRIARRATGRRRVARCGYHGWHDWCLPKENFVPAGLDEQVPEFVANDPKTLEGLFASSPRDIAAVILAPEMVLPFHPQPIRELLHITHAHGAVFIMDEVKTGFRISPHSISERIDIVPDIITLSKAMGNGWPVAAVVGRREIMSAGDGMHYSATFHGDCAAMAAALKTIAIVERDGVQARVQKMGEMLLAGLNASAKSHRIPAIAYGEPLPAMPFLRFRDPDPERNALLTRTFYATMLTRGVLMHPRHMWFISASHTEETIQRTLGIVDSTFALMQRDLCG